MANRNQLLINDNGAKYDFTIFQSDKGREVEILSKDWENSPQGYWKIPLHPWDAGLNSDRLENFRCYAKANADLSNRGLLLPPPLITTPDTGTFPLTLVTTGFNSGNNVTSAGINVPASLKIGDLVLLFVTSTDADVHTLAASSPAGTFTGLQSQQTNTNHRSRLFYKTFEGETGSYTISTGGVTVDTIGGIVAVIRNASISGLINTSAATTDSTSPYTTPSITPSANNCMIVGFASNSTNAVMGIPASWTTAGTVNDTGLALRGAYYQQSTAAAITGEFTSSGNTDGATWAVAINPANPSFTTITKFVDFNNKAWTFSSNYLISVDSSYVVTVEAAFANSITDIVSFANTLVVGFGYSTKIYTVSTSGVYTQASDNTYAGKFAVVGKNLWRSTSAVAVSSCTTSPLTLSSWGADYSVGSSSWDINVLIDYAGSIWVGKPDGFYAPDVNSNFWNQTPQLLQYPEDDNCKGAFTAKGYLWAPTISGLLRITYGESVFRGPELSNRPDFRWHTHAGYSWGDVIYLSCHDHASVEQTCIIKMVEDKDNISENDYIYHEWVRLGSTTAAGALGVTIQPTNPSLLIGHGTSIKYIKLGRGGGRDIDDPNYGYGLSWEIETGLIRPTKDLSLVAGLVGIIIVTEVYQ